MPEEAATENDSNQLQDASTLLSPPERRNPSVSGSICGFTRRTQTRWSDGTSKWLLKINLFTLSFSTIIFSTSLFSECRFSVIGWGGEETRKSRIFPPSSSHDPRAQRHCVSLQALNKEIYFGLRIDIIKRVCSSLQEILLLSCAYGHFNFYIFLLKATFTQMK